MNTPTLLYNKNLDRSLQRTLLWPDAQLSLADEDFLDAVLQNNEKVAPNFTDIGNSQARAEFLFYLLAQVSRRRPTLFPIPDLCLAAFNILAARHTLVESRLVCLDLSLLPAAVLASGWGAQVVVPALSSSKSWPSQFWPGALPDNRDMAGALILGRDPVRLTNDHPARFLKELAQAKGGIIFCFWDFFGVTLHSHIRASWLYEGLIRTLLQFPRPRRQRVVYYPALIEIASGASEPGEFPTIRLADVRELTPGPGGLPQAEILRVTLETADGEKSLDADSEEIISQENAELTPRRLLTGQRRTGEEWLERFAQVIRCQKTRVNPALIENDIENDAVLFTCREISLSQLDELTGFVKPGVGLTVSFKNFNARNQYPDGQYLLKKHDILMCFRGTEATIGRVGLVAEQPQTPLISGQSLCVIRASDPDRLDPVWLYYYLRREQVRRQILSRSSGGNMLTVNLSDLRELAIVQPGPTEIAVIGQKHQILLNLMAEIQKLYGLAKAEMTTLTLMA